MDRKELRLLLAAYDTKSLTVELMERGAIVSAEQDVFLPGSVYSRSQMQSDVGVTPAALAGARAVSDLQKFLLNQRLISVEPVELDKSHPAGDVKMRAVIICLNPTYNYNDGFGVVEGDDYDE